MSTDLQSYSERQLARATPIALWADATTDPASARRRDLLRDKQRAVAGFFQWVGKTPEQITEIDVKTWQVELEGRGWAPASVYAAISRLSSFYGWALSDPTLRQRLQRNPVEMARPKAPQPYQTESSKALDDEDLLALLAVVRAKAEAGDLVGQRDYALLLFYVLTGMRRREIIELRWGDLKINGTITITAQVKGGDHITKALDDPHVRDALLAYLRSAGRLATMAPSTPLWTRHDRAGAPGEPLTSHAFAANLKRYAAEAGIGAIHLHQTRHTFARMVAEEAGSLAETQEALGHKNLATTRVYVQRVAIRKDKHSAAIASRLGL